MFIATTYLEELCMLKVIRREWRGEQGVGKGGGNSPLGLLSLIHLPRERQNRMPNFRKKKKPRRNGCEKSRELYFVCVNLESHKRKIICLNPDYRLF